MGAVTLLLALGALCTWAGAAESTPFGRFVQLVGMASFFIAAVIAYRRHRATRHNLPDWAAWFRRL